VSVSQDEAVEFQKHRYFCVNMKEDPMKKALFTRIFGLTLGMATIGFGAVQAQECDAYFPVKNGASFEITHYDAKDKVSNVVKTTIVEKSRDGGVLVVTATAESSDGKGKEINQFTYDVTCGAGDFKMDMRSMGGSNQMAAIEGIEMKIESEDMIFPKNMGVGMSLPDAHMQMTGSMNGMTIMNTSIAITNRKVTGKESMTTPAGTFSCIVIEEDSETKSMGMNFTGHSKSWYALGVGMVRNESSSKGKPSGYSILTKISGN
jgi:hypothetical protein